MEYRTVLKAMLAIVATVSITFGSANAAERMKMHTAWGQNLPILGTGSHAFAESLNVMSDGELVVKVFDPGALVAGNAYYDSVSQGSIDMGFGVSGYHVGKNPAYAFFSSVPFGPGAGEYMAWMLYGGGQDLARELYSQDNIHFLVCGIVPPETSGWFRKEIKTTDDLRGLKMRFFGLGAKVMEKFGVSTQLLAGGDIYPALELGTIDATEFSFPAIDRNLGFYQIAKYNYFPGGHQQTTLIELLVNMDKWNGLSDAHKEMIEIACTAQMATQIAEGEATQFSYMQENEADGVNIRRWPDEILAEFEAAWLEVIAEEISASEDSQRVWESYSSFRENYAIWRANGYIN